MHARPATCPSSYRLIIRLGLRRIITYYGAAGREAGDSKRVTYDCHMRHDGTTEFGGKTQNVKQ
jgi:hypothetical protein